MYYGCRAAQLIKARHADPLAVSMFPDARTVPLILNCWTTSAKAMLIAKLRQV
jgi:hypothetical protein